MPRTKIQNKDPGLLLTDAESRPDISMLLVAVPSFTITLTSSLIHPNQTDFVPQLTYRFKTKVIFIVNMTICCGKQNIKKNKFF